MKKIRSGLRFTVYGLRLVDCKLLISLFSLSVLLSWHAKGADSSATKFDKANKYYQQLDYENAIKLYEEVLKEGSVSPAVYYNLGNAYYKTGNVAQSILNYERAHKLAPEDEDIDFNLKVASLKAVDKIEPIPTVFYKRWIDSIALSLGINAWSKVFLALLWFTVFLFAVFFAASSTFRKKLFFTLGSIFLILTLSSFYFTSVQNDIINHDEHAIVMTPSSYVKSSPDEKGNDQFILHEGTKVELLDEYSDWKKIRIANGTVGWIKSKDIEVI